MSPEVLFQWLLQIKPNGEASVHLGFFAPLLVLNSVINSIFLSSSVNCVQKSLKNSFHKQLLLMHIPKHCRYLWPVSHCYDFFYKKRKRGLNLCTGVHVWRRYERKQPPIFGVRWLWSFGTFLELFNI